MQAFRTLAESLPFSTSEQQERRKHRRLNLRCKVTLVAAGARSRFEITTENVSIGGFYGLSPRPLTAGEALECILAVPLEGCECPDPYPLLRCRVVVAWSSGAPGAAEFGIGFRIEDYRVD